MSDTDSRPVPPDRSSGNNRLERLLKVAVIVMGVLLIGGVFTVVGTIVYRLATRGVPTRGAFDAALPVNGTVRTMSLDGDRVALLVQTTGGEVVVVFDLTRGREVGRLRLDAPDQ